MAAHAVHEDLVIFLLCATVSGQEERTLDNWDDKLYKLNLRNKSSQKPLKCRRCIGANSLDDCTFSVPCPSGEVCYMDEVVTEQLMIEYHGGCRPHDVCSRGPVVGKRDGSGMICTLCCDKKTSPECNTKLCGIKSSITNTSQCYHCAFDGAGGSGVSDPSSCTRLTSCDADEVCGAETYQLSTHYTYEFKCLPKQICTLLTNEAMKRFSDCQQANPDPYMCGKQQKRESLGPKICTACCGDSQCNSGSCENLIERLYKLWTAGVLDIKTLKQNGSLPSTTPATG